MGNSRRYGRRADAPVTLTPARTVFAVVVAQSVIAIVAGLVWAGVTWSLIQLWILYHVLQLRETN